MSFNTSNNEITNTGYAYDAAGDMIADGAHTYTFDAEGNVTQIDGGSSAAFTYDAENERVRRDIPGKASNEYIFNAFGQRAAVWDATDGWASKEEAYWGSMPVEVHNSGAAHYQQQDWLGTERMVTGYTGSVEGTYTSLPFGDGFQVTGSDPDQYHFAGLDYEYKIGTNGGALAQFRMYYNTDGSWMSPDQYSASYDFTNPQSFNRYSYVANNPLSATDPQGFIEQLPGGDGGDQGGGSCFICGLVDFFESLFGFGGGGGPSFQGSLAPRPNAQPWDEYHIHWWKYANIADALGIPDVGCDFGECGPEPPAVEPGGVAGGAPSVNLSAWVLQIYAFASALNGAAPFDASIQLAAIKWGWEINNFSCTPLSMSPSSSPIPHCQYLCEANGDASAEGSVAAQNISWTSLQDHCGPQIRRCPSVVKTQTSLFWIGPIGFGGDIKVVSCTP